MSGTAAKRSGSISSIGVSTFGPAFRQSGAPQRAAVGAWRASAARIAGGGEAEHARVPHVVAGGDIRARVLQRGLFDETSHAVGGRSSGAAAERIAAFEIAESGLGMRRPDAERRQHSVACEHRATRDCGSERGLVANQMVRRQDQQHGILAVARLNVERGERDRRCRVAAERLEEERLVVRVVEARVNVRVWK